MCYIVKHMASTFPVIFPPLCRNPKCPLKFQNKFPSNSAASSSVYSEEVESRSFEKLKRTELCDGESFPMFLMSYSSGSTLDDEN